MLALSAIDRGFEPRSSPSKDYKIGICCLSAKHAALRSKSKDRLARNQNNVSGWGDLSIRGLLFQWASTIKIQPYPPHNSHPFLPNITFPSSPTPTPLPFPPILIIFHLTPVLVLFAYPYPLPFPLPLSFPP